MRAPTITFKRARTLRRAQTPPEVALWSQLKGGALEGYRFRRQHPVGPYILDFYCPAAQLAVEIDGYAHDVGSAPAHDARRDAWLAGQGVRTLRIRASDVTGDLTPVLQTLLNALREEPP